MPPPRPELICREEAQGTQQWEVVLSVSKECNVKTVRHDDNLLEALNGVYCLSSLTGCLSVEYTDCKKIDTFSLCDDKPMIFKLKGDWQGDGRKINRITKGCFIVIALSKWERTGRVPIEPDYCTDTRFKAHYFSRNEDDEIGGFKEYEGTLTKEGLTLTGDRVFDDSDNGELFVSKPPKLEPLEDYAWARVGEEKRNGG